MGTWVGVTQDLCLLAPIISFEQNIQKDKDTKSRDIFQHNADRDLCYFFILFAEYNCHLLVFYNIFKYILE